MSAATPSTQSPTVIQPQRWPLIVFPNNREDDTNRDSRLINGFIEKEAQGDIWVYKRPGFARYTRPSNGAGHGFGTYNWKGNIYTIVDGYLYKDSVPVGSTINTTNGVYRFTSIMEGPGSTPGAGAPRVLFANGVEMFYYCDATGLQNFSGSTPFEPDPFCKGISYLDGTIYLMLPNGKIYGSEINDVDSPWDALNVLTAESEPSDGVALSKQLVYVVAFKQNSTEIFYDAANIAGSPLGRVSGAKKNYGCRSADSVRELDGALFWLCTNESASVQVIKMENLEVQIISTPAIERLLANADYTTVYSWTLKLEGHKWYAITLVNNNLTLVYDVTTGVWAQWTDADGNYLPFVDSTYTTQTAQTLLQHATDGYLYTVSSNNLVDDGDEGTLIGCELITQNYDAGTSRDKFLGTLYFDASQYQGSVLKVRYTDDDYQTWSQWRDVDLSRDKPFLGGQGTFKRRAYHLKHACRTRFRIKSMDFQMDSGTL